MFSWGFKKCVTILETGSLLLHFRNLAYIALFGLPCALNGMDAAMQKLDIIELFENNMRKDCTVYGLVGCLKNAARDALVLCQEGNTNGLVAKKEKSLGSYISAFNVMVQVGSFAEVHTDIFKKNIELMVNIMKNKEKNYVGIFYALCSCVQECETYHDNLAVNSVIIR